MGGRCRRGGTHSSTALSGSRGSGWRSGGGGGGKGGTTHPGPKSASSTGLHHAGPENEKKWRGGGRGNERFWPINGLKCQLNG